MGSGPDIIGAVGSVVAALTPASDATSSFRECDYRRPLAEQARGSSQRLFAIKWDGSLGFNYGAAAAVANRIVGHEMTCNLLIAYNRQNYWGGAMEDLVIYDLEQIGKALLTKTNWSSDVVMIQIPGKTSLASSDDQVNVYQLPLVVTYRTAL